MGIKERSEEVVTRAKFYALWVYDFMRAYSLFFLPSVVLLLGSIYALFRPQATFTVVALFFCSVGFLGVICTWKLLIWRERLHDIAQKFDGRIMVHGLKMQDVEELGLSTSSKNQIIH